jgi:Flp pilus assembly protein TadG
MSSAACSIEKTAPSRVGGRGARIRRFAADEGGATAVEFGLVALPYFALIFMTFEVALGFFAQQALDSAVGNAARSIRTGEAQQQGLNLATFKNKICAQTYTLFNCTTGLKVDVRKFGSFGAINLAPPVDANGILKTDDFAFVPGSGGDIVVVRAYYEWPSFLHKLGSRLANGKFLIASAAAFKNEPFPW